MDEKGWQVGTCLDDFTDWKRSNQHVSAPWMIEFTWMKVGQILQMSCEETSALDATRLVGTTRPTFGLW
jgi:hypothetical protein